MNPWWLVLIVPTSAYAGYVAANIRWVRSTQRNHPKPSPYVLDTENREDFEYAHRDGGAWTDDREDAIRRADFLSTKPIRRRKAGQPEPIPKDEL